jgi:hypothetical protein
MGVLRREQARQAFARLRQRTNGENTPATEQAGRTGTVAGPTETSERAGEPVSGPVPRQFVIRVEPAT